MVTVTVVPASPVPETANPLAASAALTVPSPATEMPVAASGGVESSVIVRVAAGLAERCTIQLSYAIGVARPLSIYVDLHGTGKVDEAKLEKALGEAMDLTPRGIRTHLGLNRPIYARTSAYGHFGRQPDADGGFSWEKTDLADALKRAVA